MIALLSDIHSNLPALQAVLTDAKDNGCDEFISLGDVVGYGAQPGECIDLLRECGAVNVLGNHDSYLIGRQKCSRSKVVAGIIEYQRNIVTGGHLDWLESSLPFLDRDNSLFVHGGPKNTLDQYLYVIDERTVPDSKGRLFSGHTHVQVLMELASGKIYCNPGSVGQPRDGDCRAAYAIIKDDCIELRRVSYDIDAAAFAMQSAGFEAFIYEGLYKGAQIGGRIDRVVYVHDVQKT